MNDLNWLFSFDFQVLDTKIFIIIICIFSNVSLFKIPTVPRVKTGVWSSAVRPVTDPDSWTGWLHIFGGYVIHFHQSRAPLWAHQAATNPLKSDSIATNYEVYVKMNDVDDLTNLAICIIPHQYARYKSL